MKKLLLLAILTITFIACSEVDESLNPTDESLNPTDESLPAPEHKETEILQLVGNNFLFMNLFSKEHSLVLPSENTEMITPVGTPTDVYVVVQGQLTKQERIFQRKMYQFLWCFYNEQIVLVNILDNQIRPVSEDDIWEHIDANKDEWDKIYEKYYEKHIAGKEQVPAEVFTGVETLTYAAMSKQPFFHHETLEYPGDQIEVVIKHRFTYTYKLHPVGEPKEREMILVDVKRNITRPHITFPQPLLP